MVCRVPLLLLALTLCSGAVVAIDVTAQNEGHQLASAHLASFLWKNAFQQRQFQVPETAAAHQAVCSRQTDRAKCDLAITTMMPVLADWAHRRWEEEEQLAGLEGVHEETAPAPECAMCKYAVAYVKANINSEPTQEAISRVTQQACSELPAEFQETCIDVMVRYEDLLMEYIGTTNAATFCTSVGACKKSTAYPLLPTPVSAVLAETSEMHGGSFCGTCKVLVMEAHDLVEDPDTQQQIIDFLKSSCQTIVPMFADVCSQYVDEYAPAVFELLDEYLDDDLCASLGFCAAPSWEETAVIDATLSQAEVDAAEAVFEEQLQDQQQDMLAYVAGMLLTQDIEAKQRGDAHFLRGSDSTELTQELIDALVLGSQSGNAGDRRAVFPQRKMLQQR